MYSFEVYISVHIFEGLTKYNLENVQGCKESFRVVKIGFLEFCKVFVVVHFLLNLRSYQLKVLLDHN